MNCMPDASRRSNGWVGWFGASVKKSGQLHRSYEELLRLISLRVIAAVLVLLPLVAACGHGSKDDVGAAVIDTTAQAGGQARPFLMGVSSQPAQATDDAYSDAFDLAESAGEVVLIQRTPPWSEFVPGGSISNRTEQLTLLEKKLADEHHLKLFLAVDPTLPGDRSQLANLPEDLAGQGFANPDVRAAFIAYAKYLALNYKPAYMALGVEVDMIYRARGESSFGNFVSLYSEAYDAVKSVSPNTMVFPTFQYEDMLGLLNTGSPTLPSWSLLKRFEPKIDLLAVTSYPSLVFSSVSEVPMDYYDALKDQIDKPVIFASVGWNSSEDPSTDPSDSSQVSFLYRVLSAAESLKARMVVWYLGRDPETMPSGFEPLAHMGLHDAAGTPKPVWRIWLSALDRPAQTSGAITGGP
jgi:hypothetical protein